MSTILSNLNQTLLSCVEISIHDQNVPRLPYVCLQFLMHSNVKTLTEMCRWRKMERYIRIYKFKKCIKIRSAYNHKQTFKQHFRIETIKIF